MSRMPKPLFLARRGYRQRRLADAARLLPVLGAVLILLPLLWGGAGAATTSRVGLYLFAVWFGLIAAAFVLSRRIEPPPGPDSEGATREGAE